MTPRAATPTGADATRRALFVIGAAFTANALLLAARTAAAQLLPSCSPSAPAVSSVLRCGFLGAGAALVVGFMMLARAKPSLHGFTLAGAALTAFAVLAELAGLASALAGNGERGLRSASHVMNAVEPVTSLAATLLAVLALSALASRRARALVVVLALSVGVTFAFCVVRLVDAGPTSPPAECLSWLIEVARLLLVGTLALRLARGMRGAVATPSATAPEGPYRTAGEGPPPPAKVDVPDAATAASLRVVAGGLALYRLGFLVHVASTVATTSIAATLLFFLRVRETSLAFVAVPLASLVTTAIMAVGLARLRALPRASGTGGLARAALVTTLGGVLTELGSLVHAMLVVAASSSAIRTEQQLGGMFVLGWPLAALVGVSALLVLVSAFARIGEKVGEPRLATRARWVQGLVVTAGACQMSWLLALHCVDTTRVDYTRSAVGMGVVYAFALAGVAATLAVVLLHVLLVGATRRALLAHAAQGQP